MRPRGKPLDFDDEPAAGEGLAYAYLDGPTLADAILDRIAHSSHKIELKGRSLRDNQQDK